MRLRLSLFGVLAMLFMLGGCGAYESDIDLAPMEARPVKSPLEPGRYCAAEWNESDLQLEVRGAGDCGIIAWDETTRRLVLDDEPPAPDSQERVAPVKLEDDLFLLQMQDDKPDAERKPGDARFASMLVLMGKDAMLGLPSLDDTPYRSLAASRKDLTFRNMGDDERPILVSGDREAALNFITGAGALAVKLNDRSDRGFSVLVREDGHTDHMPDGAQAREISQLLAKARALAKTAPPQ